MMAPEDVVPAPPDLSLEATEDLHPRPPFAWVRPSLAPGLDGDTLHLMAAWTAFTLATGTAWALHLRELLGWSALSDHWGERLTARDLWELWENGGWQQDPLGAVPTLVGALSLLWVLWAGWRLQARTVDLPHRLGPWAGGALDALLLGAPVAAATTLALEGLEWLGTTGITGLGWMNLVVGPLFKASAVSAWMVLWWFCRLDRAKGLPPGFRGYGTHLGHSFLRLWMHPVQWFLLLFGSAALRAGLGFGALAAGWRWGGGTSLRVWGLVVLQAFAAAGGAWILGILLRLTAHFWRQDCRVREARQQLRLAFPRETVLDQN